MAFIAKNEKLNKKLQNPKPTLENIAPRNAQEEIYKCKHFDFWKQSKELIMKMSVRMKKKNKYYWDRIGNKIIKKKHLSDEKNWNYNKI